MTALDLPQDWPHRTASRQIAAVGQLWHVQIMGAGPDLLLIHGAGGSVHCWRDLAPLLAAQYRVIAVDVAGQGFSQRGRFARASLSDVAQDIIALQRSEGWDIRAIIGHSAGAAIGLQMARNLPQLRALIGLNAALSQFEGVAGWLFPALAKGLSLLPFAGSLGAQILGRRDQIDKLLAQTGAKISHQGQAQYLTLARRPGHIGATLQMMAAWDLRPLLANLPQISLPALFLTGSLDGAVPPKVSLRAAQAMPRASARILHGYGHLLPEEAADVIAPMCLTFLAQALGHAHYSRDSDAAIEIKGGASHKR